LKLYFQNIPDTVHVCGRISPEQVYDYLAKMRKVGTKVNYIHVYLESGFK